MNLKHIIFDFDYTLADSSNGVFSCNNHALTKLGFPQTTYEASCRTIGLSLGETYAALTARPVSEAEEFIRLFIEQAENVMADMTVLFAQTPSTIKQLKASGFILGIVSTKFRYRIETILRRENLLQYFDVIVGGEDVVQHKPDPESLLLAMAKLGATLKNTSYVGDSIVDAMTAAKVGIPFIAVLSGVTTADAFNAHPYVHILEGVSDLLAIVSIVSKDSRTKT